MVAITDFLSCSRASTGYAKTSGGTLTSFGNNVLRRTDLGLLIEDARTNVVQSSANFGGPNWTVTRGAISAASSIIDPTGGTATTKFVDDSNVNTHVLQYGDGTSYTGDQIWSIFLKAAEQSNPQIQISDNATGAVSAVADLNAGTIGSVTTTGGWSGATATIEAYVNGWYRATIYGNVGATPRLILARVLTNAGATYAGTGTGVYVWGAQIEQNTFASSYIPTAGTLVTRALDSVSCISVLNSVLVALPQTVVMDLTSAIGAFSGIGNILRTSSANYAILYAFGSDVAVTSSDNGADLTKGFSGSATFTAGTKIGLSLDSATRSLTAAGLSPATDTGSFVAAAATVYLGANQTNAAIFGYIRRATFWNTKLADATLQTLTTPSGYQFPYSGASVDLDFQNNLAFVPPPPPGVWVTNEW